MARYIGPKSRISRRFGEAIFGPDKVLAKRNFPPGQHGNDRRRKQSEYGSQLAEKQKAKYTYGVSSATCLRRLQRARVSPVRFSFSFSRAVWTTLFSVWVLLLLVLPLVSS